MPPSESIAVEALADRTRLLHVGLMKTGTTAVQHAASTRRQLLLRHGVRYPGQRYNHRQPALALMGRTTSVSAERPDAWDTLMREVEADACRRIWISNEFISECDDDGARRFLDELGPRTHIAVTLRSVPAVLPSIWQQHVRTGTRLDFEAWLANALADAPDARLLPPAYGRHDQGAVVTRWARLAGGENVTVIVADKARPQHLEQAFAALLGLPSGVLTTSDQRGGAANRSLSAQEAALILRVNEILQPGQMTHDELTQILRGGAVARLLHTRQPPDTDSSVALPPWAHDRARQLGECYAATIAGSGVQVLGDLSQLSDLPAARGGRSTMPDLVPTELAAQAVVGAMSAGLNRGSDFGPTRPPAARALRSPAPTVRRLLRTAWRRSGLRRAVSRR